MSVLGRIVVTAPNGLAHLPPVSAAGPALARAVTDMARAASAAIC